MSLRSLSTLVIVCLAAASRGRGDTVLLRNGMKIRGRVVTDAGGTVVVKVQHGVVRLGSDEVVDIQRDDEATNLLADAQELARSGRYASALKKIEAAALKGASGDAVERIRLNILRRHATRLEGTLRLTEAHEVLRQAQTLAPEDAGIASALERVARRLSELRGLVESARSAVEHDDLAGAYDLYDRSVQAAPEMRLLIGREFADVCEDLGDVALMNSDTSAAQWYGRALSLEPERAAGLRQRYTHARLLPILDLFEGGRVGAALELMATLVEFAPADAQVRYLYGRILETNGRRSEARRQYATALSEDHASIDPLSASFDLGSLKRQAKARLRDLHGDAEQLRSERLRRAAIDDGPATRVSGEYFVVHGRNRWLAERVLEAAQGQVDRIVSALGNEEGLGWERPCPVYLLPDAEAFQAATGQPSWSGGLSHTESLNGRLARQYLTVYQTSSRLLESTVPHEVAHLVFSAMTGYSSGVPLVLHEGFAVSQESAQGSERDRGMLAWRRLSGDLLPLSELMRAKTVGDDPGLFYVQGESVARFLMSRPGGMAVYVEFARSVAHDGLDEALGRHYGLSDVDELEGAWLGSLDLR